MATTKYVVSATATYPTTKQLSRKNYAIAEATMRARAEKFTVEVTVHTTGGKLVHTVPATSAPAPVAAPAKAPAKAVPAPAPAAKAASKPPVKATRRGQRRPGMGDADLKGYEVLYRFPRLQCEVLRGVDEDRYALYCITHDHAAMLTVLSEDRVLRREGNWCPSCVAEGGPTANTPARRRALAAA